MISTDDGAFVFILLFIGLKVEADVGINTSSVPVWIFRMRFVLSVLKAQIWGNLIIYSSKRFQRRIRIDHRCSEWILLFCHSLGLL